MSTDSAFHIPHSALLHKADILIADDRPINLQLMEAILSGLGHNLIMVGSGEEALQYLLHHDAAVILLDVMMPGMDGFETARRIRQLEKSRHIPIIFVTAFGRDDRNVSRGYELGAVDYVFTPVVPDILRSKVTALVDLYRVKEQSRLQADALASLNRKLTAEIEVRKAAEEKIGRLNGELEEKARQLEAANRELEAFVYSVSHDLRAPLRGISGFSQALLEDCGKELGEAGAKHLDRIRSSVTRMEQIIEDLLKLARVTRSPMLIETIDLSLLAGNIIEDFRSREPERRVEALIHDGMTGRADERLMRIMLENLLGNAWKFTSRKADARIEVGLQETADGDRFYYVKDNGAGFEQTHVGKLFSPFQRLHHESEFPGTGIGLSIVRRILQRHDGRIWAEGEEGKGATFFFTIGER